MFIHRDPRIYSKETILDHFYKKRSQLSIEIGALMKQWSFNKNVAKIYQDTCMGELTIYRHLAKCVESGLPVNCGALKVSMFHVNKIIATIHARQRWKNISSEAKSSWYRPEARGNLWDALKNRVHLILIISERSDRLRKHVPHPNQALLPMDLLMLT